MTRPRTFCLEHDLSTEPVTVEVAKAAVKAYLHGVVGLSGLLCNGELDPEGDLLRTVCPFGDSMHNSGGHAKDHVKGTFAELKAVEERERLKEHLKSKGVMKESMTLAEWVYACLTLCLPAEELDGVVLPIHHVEHAFHTADLRRLFYVNMHYARSRGYVLAVWCSLAKFVSSLMKCHDGKEQTKSGCSGDAFRGLYACGCIDLAIMARLVAPEQGCCENGEGALKPVKDCLLSRSNFHWDDVLELLQRFNLARDIDKATNTPSSASATSVESRSWHKEPGFIFLFIFLYLGVFSWRFVC